MTDESNHASPPPKPGWRQYSRQAWARLQGGWANVKTSLSSDGSVRSAKSYIYLLLLVIVACFVLFLLYWLLDRIFVYYVARSYVQEIAEAFDLNQHLADAIVYLTFIALAIFVGMVVRFSKKRRLVGIAGIFSLLIAHSLAMWWATSRETINRKGEALKCYVITRDSVRYGERPGIDPQTGRECRQVTPEIIGKLREYETGKRPTRIVGGEPQFFDRGTGEPIVWYHRNKDNGIELFDLMGFHPETGEELLPVTKEVVEQWKGDYNRKAPQEIDPKTFVFFDPITGKPRGWYWRGENSEYKFYDRPGFYPLTGEALSLVTRDVIVAWQKYLDDLQAQKCYVITPTTVKYGTHPGIDPNTGRECRLLTAEMLRRLREYESGNRPKRIDDPNPTFFDLGTGEPIVWYYKDKNGEIQLFNLMGFHPETGDELLPITKEVVDVWKGQVEGRKRLTARPPQRVDPNKYAFFDPVTGKPRVWYWRNESGDYEFYDGPGFQPRTGVQLLIVTSDAIHSWQAEEKQNEVKQQQDEQRREEEQRKQAEQTERDKSAASTCDQLAANPYDPKKSPEVTGVPYDSLRYQARDAIAACTTAVQQNQNELRFQYQLARALEFNNPDAALEIQLKLGRIQYAAAYDNAGGILSRKGDYSAAISQFELGVQHGDPDAMVSLAEMIKKGRASGNYIALYQRAASMGDQEAQAALAQEQQQQQQIDEQVAKQKRAMEILGNVLQNFRR